MNRNKKSVLNTDDAQLCAGAALSSCVALEKAFLDGADREAIRKRIAVAVAEATTAKEKTDAAYDSVWKTWMQQ